MINKYLKLCFYLIIFSGVPVKNICGALKMLPGNNFVEQPAGLFFYYLSDEMLVEICKFLDPDDLGRFGRTCKYINMIKNDKEFEKSLFKAKLDFKEGKKEAASLLIEYGNNNTYRLLNALQSKNLTEILLKNICKNLRKTINFINHINSLDNNGNAPIHSAILNKNNAVVKLLFFFEIDIEVLDKYGRTPFYLAVLDLNCNVAKLLLENRANIEALNRDGCTPLNRVAFSGNCNVAKLLLENGANIEALDRDGRTPLNRAVFSCNFDIAKLLLKNRANIEALDRDGYTTLNRAVFHGDCKVARLLLENRANPNFGFFAELRNEIFNNNDAFKLLTRAIRDPENPHYSSIAFENLKMPILLLFQAVIFFNILELL